MELFRRLNVLAYIFSWGCYLPLHRKENPKSDVENNWHQRQAVQKSLPRHWFVFLLPRSQPDSWLYPGGSRACSQQCQRAFDARWPPGMPCVNNFRFASHWFFWEPWTSLYWRRCHSFECLFTYLLRSAKWRVITGFRLQQASDVWELQSVKLKS